MKVQGRYVCGKGEEEETVTLELKKKDDVAIVVAGQAGQGIQTIESILTRVLKRSGYHVFATKEYMSRIRGGSNSTLIRVGNRRAQANVDRIDILVPLDQGAIKHLSGRISKRTLIIGERENLGTRGAVHDIPFSRIAEEVGGRIYSNTVAIAALFGLLEGDLKILEDFLSSHFTVKGEAVVEKNLKAAREGYRAGSNLRNSVEIPITLVRDPRVADEILINGGEAVALGAISGGCRFIASYPMSPGTAVLTNLSKNDSRFGIIAEQAEDEIAAVNMAIGAWYAGGRAMVTTSGGGFSLMQEGVSLSGITESPLVVHIGQRPGPATGMATRTEQADLDLTLHAGHGEFPRIIYAPGRIQDTCTLTHRAFEMADRHQVPVFVLTDQYLIDSYYSVPDLDTGQLEAENRFVRPAADYRRYAYTPHGVSPRGIPGYGEGLVSVDGHEHTESGHITEEIETRNQMMKKRMGKLEGILGDSLRPSLTGSEDYRVLVVGWGSTYHMLTEAVDLMEREDVSVLHFSQVFPLHPDTGVFLDKAQVVIVVENNYTGQFRKLLRTVTGIDARHSILKYDGRPFCSEDLAQKILGLTGKGGGK